MKTYALHAAMAALVVLAGTSARAQTRLEADDSVTGALTAASARYQGKPADCFVVETEPGVNYEVRLGSRDFDSYLRAGEGRRCGPAARSEDDDGGDGLNAMLRFVGNGQPWFLEASSVGADATGEYRLSFDRRFVLPPHLDIDGVVAGALDGDDLQDQSGAVFDCVQTFAYHNQPARIDLRSGAFDAKLSLHSGSDCMGEAIAADDDGGGGTDSMIAIRLPGSGDYSMRISAFDPAQGGAWRISITDPDKGKSGRALWGDAPVAAGCGYRPGSRAFRPIVFRAAPSNSGGTRRLTGVIVANGAEQTREEAGFSFAESRAWYLDNADISLNGRSYSKYGLPRLLDPGEIDVFTEYDGVGVAVADGDTSADVIYVHVNGFECSFQPYQAAS